MKVDADKFAKTMQAQDKEDEEKHGCSNDEWAEEMSDVYESEVAPAEIQEMFDHQDGLGKNKAMFILADGSVSEEMGAGSIAKTAAGTEGVQALIINGPISDRIQEIADEYNLPIIEDAAEAIGSRSDLKHLGTFGTLGILSFNGNKTLTTGGGGVVLTDHNSIAQQLKHLSTTARITSGYELEHDVPGFNYRMPNLNAAMGIAQLENLPNFLSKKRSLASHYHKIEIPNSKWLKEQNSYHSNYWLNAIQLDSSKLRNDLLANALRKGILCRPIWKPIHSMAAYSKFPKDDLSVTEKLSNRIVCLPSGLKGLKLKNQ